MSDSFWQPGETAPKDGNLFLAFVGNNSGVPLVLYLYWDDGMDEDEDDFSKNVIKRDAGWEYFFMNPETDYLDTSRLPAQCLPMIGWMPMPSNSDEIEEKWMESGE